MPTIPKGKQHKITVQTMTNAKYLFASQVHKNLIVLHYQFVP